jgi:hypothetical protein
LEDQAGMMDLVDEAFRELPLKIQKKMIQNLLYNDSWDPEFEHDKKEFDKYRKYVGLE